MLTRSFGLIDEESTGSSKLGRIVAIVMCY